MLVVNSVLKGNEGNDSVEQDNEMESQVEKDHLEEGEIEEIEGGGDGKSPYKPEYQYSREELLKYSDHPLSRQRPLISNPKIDGLSCWLKSNNWSNYKRSDTPTERGDDSYKRWIYHFVHPEKYKILDNGISCCCIAQDGYLANIYLSVLESSEGHKRLWRVIHEMGHHQESLVKVILLMQLPQLVMVSQERDRDVCTQWRLLLEYLVDGDERIRKSSQIVLLFFAKRRLLDDSLVEEFFCPAIEKACMEFPDNVDLLCKMCPIVGAETTRKHFLQRFISLCSHDNFSIREICVKNFPLMCSIVGNEESNTSLLPTFIQLCHDPVFNIRSACIDIFVSIACIFTLDKRKNEFTSAYNDLLLDECESCRMSAYRTLGAFICTFADPETFGSDWSRLADHSRWGFISDVRNLTAEENCETISVNYVKKLFPSFNSCGEVEDLNSSTHSLSAYGDSDKLFDMNLSLFNELGKINNLESEKILVLRDQNYPEVEEDDNKKISEELDEFNSFRFWQMPFVEIDALADKSKIKFLTSEKTCNLGENFGNPTYYNILGYPQGTIALNIAKSVSNWSDGEGEANPFWSSVPTSRDIRSENFELSDTGAESCVSDEFPFQSQDIVPQILLNHFVSMAYQTYVVAESALEEEKAHSCAYWLPAVAFTLGPKNWPCIRSAYKNLSENFYKKVRKTVASNLHELASMLGEEITTKDLVPIFDNFMVDWDDVKIKALKHLSEFFRNLIPEKRKYFLFKLLGFLKSHCNFWRVRAKVVEQLKLCILLFTPLECFECVVPLASSLLCDEVASVRDKSLELMSDIIAYLHQESNIQISVINQLLKDFATHSSWRRRQTFVFLCSRLALHRVLDEDTFTTFFLDHLLRLGKDFVPNVGLCAARCLSVSLIRNKFISSSSSHFETIMKALKELEQDKDRDVRYFASLYIDNNTESSSNRSEEKLVFSSS